ncbi:ATP-binding cassette domain-containing protein [Pseudoalteromonas sp. 10-33]|jgi:molybdate transport system ATP-binding protein|uniref:ATP-binding cassette domain-containing protein n=1 Tax=Pseudoalteromonas sp. 10-33 TaxID=1761890 RepID=UPI00073238EC|nr:ATP-binding cassette domain-containing protein [Pseudoalteromonas sp. 10-33]KTF13555.1 molybdenum ABC transporter ATP-binding protein [Pseudoalteromonas sp. 10-33]
MIKLTLFKALNNFDLDIKLHLESFTIAGFFGPSGSGKSTLLRCISGLEGEQSVYINHKQVDHLPTEQRGVTLQVQSCPLFPHLDVAGNLAFTQTHCTNRQTDLTEQKVIEALELQPLLKRDVHSLSGGERQRVVFARTLLAGQKFIILDEPFSALDWPLRFKTLSTISELAAKYNIKFILVSHSLKELLFCCDTLVQLNSGKVINHGPSAQVAKAIYANNKQTPLSLINFQIIKFDEKYGVYQLKLQESEQQLFALPSAVEQGNKLILECEQISVSADRPVNVNNSNVLVGVLVNAELINGSWQLALNIDGQTLYCLHSKRLWEQSSYKLGDTLYAAIHNLE